MDKVDEEPQPQTALSLSSDEQRVLDLFDTIQQLRIEMAIVRALQTGNSGASEPLRDDLLEARAKLKLRNDAIEAVMMANPILRAVHNGTDASPIERHADLLPFVERRDEAAVAVAGQASDMESIRSQLTVIHSETVRVTRHNVELTAELCDLADQLRRRKVGSGLGSPGTRSAVTQLEQQVANRRKRWRAIKGVVSGVVCGSGIDWADDDELRGMVLDPEDEDERL
ncbi:hypothetical protein CDD80_4197 [Ophiocordyceps camponoti-rufipedis]|uniref:Centromere protein H C-terminal domain-containing protein n=1 Tax=Ophiocordyceps camponoti-rufipedis TaxID=2004952 RepID=A0A2C5YZ37_9HYPO|nr:hypothetical protein CDD80_4197 [Ophiocordyceps camponoti-rufipedis]